MAELKSGQLTRITQQLARIIAPNPGIMTGPGTNTYLIGQQAIAVVDPGPADASHIEAIERAVPAGAKIKWVITTHAHEDHSPGAMLLAERTGAEICGSYPLREAFEDSSFKPHRTFSHDETLDTGECSIRAIHTPGHVGNHFCYLLEEEGVLLTGDHIMNGSTVVIIPPSGDMKDYIASLEKLKRYRLKMLGPGHGAQMENPFDVIQGIIDHRLARERKVIAGMEHLCAATLDELTALVYADVPVSIHPIARLSLWAHLIKLEKEHVVSNRDETWRIS
jgi:glyoxylase-like metal-dependent hydrolase (beta-lactamase superfamily II)